MAVIDDLRTKLGAIGDAVRLKTASSDLLTMDGMVEAINSIATGTSIDGGYTVNFHDSEGVLLQSHIAMYGYKVDLPLSHLVDHWEDADGQVVNFPLILDADSGIDVLDLYAAGSETYEYVIYKHFGVDKAQYPYLIMRPSSNISYAGVTTVIFSNNSGGFYDSNRDGTIDCLRGDHLIADVYPNTTPVSDSMYDNVTELLNMYDKDDLRVTRTGTNEYAIGIVGSNNKSYMRVYTNFAFDGIDGRLDTNLYGGGIILPPYTLQEKTVTANGSVTADEGYYGLSKVTVNVPSSGGGGSSGGGTTADDIEGGHKARFFDENNTLLQVSVVRDGLWLDKPIYDCDSWQNINGYVNTFPLILESDVDFYAAVSTTYIDSIYKFAGVDKVTYPYFIFDFNNREGCKLLFGSNVSISGNTLTITGGYYINEILCTAPTDHSDLTNVSQIIMDILSEKSLNSGGDNVYVRSNAGQDYNGVHYDFYYYTNFDIRSMLAESMGYDINSYRLDVPVGAISYRLYTHFGISRSDYPYVIINFSPSGEQYYISLNWFKSISYQDIDSNIIGANDRSYVGVYINTTDIDLTDVVGLIDVAIEAFPDPSIIQYSSGGSGSSNINYYNEATYASLFNFAINDTFTSGTSHYIQ